MSSDSIPSATRVLLTGAVTFLLVSLAAGPLWAQFVGPNVNMVSGTQWPGGDPFLQRQNEPSMAVSSRNPVHILAGSNDYRTVDLPGVSGESEPTGDAWLGVFNSFDGGKTWTSTLIPGYPQDQSPAGKASPLKGLGAGADPSVRAGTNGMFYYSGLAFNRDGSASKVFVAAFTDDNNLEGGDSIRYLWTSVAKNSSSNTFEDKPSLAVDLPRPTSLYCVIAAQPLEKTQIFRAGTVYVAWTEFIGDPDTGPARIMYSRSIDCGLTWSAPQQLSNPATTFNQGASLAIDPNTGTLYIAWRVFATTSPAQPDAIVYVASFDGGKTFTKPALITNISPFDQGDTAESFRTNAYPAIAVDAAGHVYVAWSQRGAGLGGDARIMVLTGTPVSPPNNNPLKWSAPVTVDPSPTNRGHQIMPAVAFSAGKLTVAWYDLRNDDLLALYTPLLTGGGQYSVTLENACVVSGSSQCSGVPAFGSYIVDPTPGSTPPLFASYAPNAWRQTLDVRAAQATPGIPPSFLPSVQVSQYAFGSLPPTPANPTPVIQQLEVNAPNLPMFQSGTLPFIGDYIDVAGPTFIANHDGTWRFNNQPTDPDFTHVVWTDNRNVVPPADQNWLHYTPPIYGTSTTSIFDPTQQRPACTLLMSGGTNAGDRNQDIYTAQLSPGLVVSAPGNAKTLGTGPNGQLIQRQFPIVVSNTTNQTRYYELTVNSQPTGGVASFLQFPAPGPALTAIQVQVPPLSSTSRGLFVTSTNASATVTVNVAEITGLTTPPTPPILVPGGETGSVTINGDPNNPPNLNANSNTENYTPIIATPNVSNPNVSNPNVSNPNVSNPNVSNPNVSNPNVSNPNVSNPNVSNADVANPNIGNPNVSNTDLSDGTITDGTWTVTNTGNTSSAYAVNLTGQNPPPGVKLQLIIYQNYTTPFAQGCNLTVRSHFVPVASITNVTFATLSQILEPAASNPAIPGLALTPGQTAVFTLRAVDTTTNIPAQALADYNPSTQASPIVVSQGANTGTTQPSVTLTILTKSLPQATLTGVYNPPAPQQPQATGGSGTYTWSVVSGSGTPPTGITLTSGGVLSGTPTGIAGTYSFTVQVEDAVGDIAQQPLMLVVNPAPSITTTALPTAADQGHLYTQTIAATGGTGPLSFTAVTVDGVSLNASGQFSGVPTSPGSFPFTATVTDTLNVSATQSLTLVVNAAPSITTTALPTAADQGHLYTQTIAATGGTGTLSFTAVTVDGVSLNASGQFSGIPTSPGSFPFMATVTDTLNVSATQSLTLTVNAGPSITTTALPTAADQGHLYTQTIAATGGTGTLSFTAVTVDGVSLNASGQFSGVPTSPGSFPFTATVTDTLNVSATQSLTLVVNAAPSITTTALPTAADQGHLYTQTIAATGGTGTLSFTAVTVDGVTLNASGQFSGIPTSPGSFPFMATVTDTLNVSATQSLTLTVNPVPSITTTALPTAADQGHLYTQTIAATGGTGALSFTAVTVDGVSLNASGQFSGVPTSTGTFPFTATVTDTLNVSATQSLTLTVNLPPSIATTALPPTEQGLTYSTTIAATGGTGTLSFTPVTVDGVTLDSMGHLTGMPAAPGAIIPVTVTDSLGVSASANLSLTVYSPLLLGAASLPPGTLNFPYQPQQLAASGGLAPYSNWMVTNGSLPVGLSLGSTGIISGTPTAAGTNPFTISVTDSFGVTAQQSYSITGGFIPLGSAAVNGTGIQLTSGRVQAGAAWAGTQQSVASGFLATFQFQITPGADSTYFADGLAFVIHADPRGSGAIGFGGGDIGYAGITNSLAVEFDTYDNSGPPIDDPNNNHIAIISNGTGINYASHCVSNCPGTAPNSSVLAVTNMSPMVITNNMSTPLNLVDGNVHDVTISYTGGPSGTLSVSVDNSPIVSATNVDLQSLLGLPASGTAWVGFTGGSGDGGENGDIYNWSYSVPQ